METKETQKIKMELLEKYGRIDDLNSLNFCREAYKFVMEGSVSGPVRVAPEPAVINIEYANIPNGVYIVFDDGSYSPFESCMQYYNVAFVGVSHDGHTFGVPLNNDYGRSRLLEKDEYPEDEHCYQREMDALLNWNFVEETAYLKQLGLAVKLREGHYLPTAPVFLAMYANREKLNKALDAVGGQPVDFASSRWFAQRSSVSNAWLFFGYTRPCITTTSTLRFRSGRSRFGNQ